VINAGAHIGMTCISLLKAGYFGRAIAFEPAPNSYRLLLRNIQQNHLEKVIRTFPFALSSEEGELQMELSSDNSGDNRIRTKHQPGFFKEEKRSVTLVRVRTLDATMKGDADLHGEQVRLVWTDIQGHEGHFFEGARDFFRKGIPAVCEFWPYGIDRSGISPDRFLNTVKGLFTHYYVFDGTAGEQRPIDELRELFPAYAGPRQMCLLALFP
jgi:FkbM family methyltransferase